MCYFLLSLSIELMRVSSSVLAQNKVVKITTWSGEDFSYHDDCGNCAQGLTPHLLLAINLSHFPILDLFFFFLFNKSRLGMHRKSGYACHLKSWERCEEGNCYSVIWSCSYCCHRRFDERSDPRRAECDDALKNDFYKLLDMQPIRTLFAAGVACCLPSGFMHKVHRGVEATWSYWTHYVFEIRKIQNSDSEKQLYLGEILCHELTDLVFQSWRPPLRKILIFNLH